MSICIQHSAYQCTRAIRLLKCACLSLCIAHAQAEDAPQQVEIIATLPLSSLAMLRNEIAAPVQTANTASIMTSGALELGDFLQRRFASVHVNDLQGNPYQMDVSYRGYTASPLLGTPQGLSVYLDGVRMNQPFGDIVSWDLLPRTAIDTLTLMPGSNPLFGLNTLGGALVLQTKDGRRHPGTSVQASLGAYARRSLEFEHGGNAEQLDWYINGNLFREQGWREDSPSDVRQLFGKMGWRDQQDKRNTLKLSFAHANNDLTGNGLQEQGLLRQSWNSVYSKPDQTKNRASLLNLQADHYVTERLKFSGNLYWRSMRNSSVNGDINPDALGHDVMNLDEENRAALVAAGYPVNSYTPSYPYWSCIAQALQQREPAEYCTGLLNRSTSHQENAGTTAQWSLSDTLFGWPSQFVLGAAYDTSRIHFQQSSQLGYLTNEHNIVGLPYYADGRSGGMLDGEAYDNRVDLSGQINNWSLYSSLVLTPNPRTTLTLSGRYNQTSIHNRDHLHADTDIASLSGNHRYARFNPAFGLTYSPSDSLNVYASYSASSRAPTATELGCANPEHACKLPNAMAGDPPLKQVQTSTVEIGMRGGTSASQWSMGVFAARNRDDILFVANQQAGFGYFKNFGETRRQGFELSWNFKTTQFNVDAQYSYLDARYQSAEQVNGAANSSNQSGAIAITSGNRIPLLPRQLLKLHAEYAFNSALKLSAGIVAVAASPARGNENGLHRPDGQHYVGSGQNPGYATLNLGASLRITPQWTATLHIDNAFDTRYTNAAQLGGNALNAEGRYAGETRNSTFYAPGSPRQIHLNMRYEFGRKK